MTATGQALDHLRRGVQKGRSHAQSTTIRDQAIADPVHNEQGLMKEFRKLILRMATDNSSWGCSQIQDELKKLNHTHARSTIAKSLKDLGISSSTGRATT